MTPARVISLIAALVVTGLGAGAWSVGHSDPGSPDRQPTAATADGPVVDDQPDVFTASAAPPDNHCAHNDAPQLIIVSIKRQHEWACAGHRTVQSSPVTTGASSRPGDATPRGTFAVQGLDRDSTLRTSAAGAYQVRYWIPFHLGVWGFHDAAWQRIPFGSPRYVTHGSHGCVHMPLAAIRWLFHWVHYGTEVRIR